MIAGNLNQVASVMAEVNRLKLLTLGWDGYNAAPINSRIIGAAVEFVENLGRIFPETTQVSPTPRGGILFEWHKESRTLEIEFMSPIVLRCLKFDAPEMMLEIDEESVVAFGSHSRIRDLLSWFKES